MKENEFSFRNTRLAEATGYPGGGKEVMQGSGTWEAARELEWHL